MTCRKCGATCELKDRARFLRRHPAKCQANANARAAQQAFMKELAAGTRCVDSEEGNRVTPKSLVGKKRTGLV